MKKFSRARKEKSRLEKKDGGRIKWNVSGTLESFANIWNSKLILKLKMATSFLYLLVVSVAAFASRGNCERIDKCATDPSYSYRVCNAIRSYLQTRTPCDKAEIIKLQRKIYLLESKFMSKNRTCLNLAKERL